MVAAAMNELGLVHKRRTGKTQNSNVEPPKFTLYDGTIKMKICISKRIGSEKKIENVCPIFLYGIYIDYLIRMKLILIIKVQRPHGIANACFRWFGNTLIKYHGIIVSHCCRFYIEIKYCYSS